MSYEKRKAVASEPYLVIRELYRNREALLDHHQWKGRDVIEYKGYLFAAHELTYEEMIKNLKKIPLKAREAFFYNVLLDLGQKESGELMGVGPVTIAQHVERASRMLAKIHFPDLDVGESKSTTDNKRYRLMHSDRIRENKRRYYEKHRERILAAKKARIAEKKALQMEEAPI